MRATETIHAQFDIMWPLLVHNICLLGLIIRGAERKAVKLEKSKDWKHGLELNSKNRTEKSEEAQRAGIRNKAGAMLHRFN